MSTMLTKRETEAADLFQAGLSTTAVARKLGISSTTARKHRTNITRKTGRSFTPIKVKSRTLTQREREAILLLAEDLPYKLIADRMEVSYNTIKYFFQCAYKKLGVTTSHGAVAKLLRSMS